MSSDDVEKWLAAYDNPMKPVVVEMRRLIMMADPRIGETIKWQAPTFVYKRNIASFFPRAKKHASLMFHDGASIEGNFPNLEGEGKAARSFKVADLEELDAKAAELQSIFVAWCDQRDNA